MKLDRVTITGADDSVDPRALSLISRRYPFVEWGILVSASSQGAARYPTDTWIRDLQAVDKAGKLNLSLHVCGRWVRALLLGIDEVPPWLLIGMQRAQLNFHAERTPCDPVALAHVLAGREQQFIFQIDGETGNKHLEGAIDAGLVNAVPLFDISGGAGILPDEWPRAATWQAANPGEPYFGYAGGLGPHNLPDQLPLIADAAGDSRIWIDMETWVRSKTANGDVFDLDKVELCLDMASHYIAG